MLFKYKDTILNGLRTNFFLLYAIIQFFCCYCFKEGIFHSFIFIFIVTFIIETRLKEKFHRLGKVFQFCFGCKTKLVMLIDVSNLQWSFILFALFFPLQFIPINIQPRWLSSLMRPYHSVQGLFPCERWIKSLSGLQQSLRSRKAFSQFPL